MSFGKNRVQYHEPYWRYFRYQDFDVYYDKAGRDLAEFVAKNAVVLNQEVKSVLDISYSRRIIFIVYNTLNDLKQSNIGLSSSEDQYNIGGTTQIVDNKIILYFNGDHNDLKQQIRKGIALLMVREFLFGSENYREIISNSALHDYPDWFVYGLTEFVSGNWNPELEDQLFEGFESKKYQKLVHLEYNDALIVGNALWKYISEMYGNQAISNILFIAKVTEDIDAAFSYVLGKPLQILVEDMVPYYKTRHQISNTENFKGEKIQLPRRAKKVPVSHVTVSPDFSKLLFVSNNSGKATLWYRDLQKKRAKKISSQGNILKQITDYSYPVAAWHPSGDFFAYFFEEKGTIWLYIYSIKMKEVISREFHHFEKVLDFEYSNNGNYIVFSGVKNGQTDIYTYNPQTYNYTQLTDDIADDRFPSCVQNDNNILFSSNRNNPIQKSSRDSVRNTYDLFIISKNQFDKNVQRIQNTSFDNEYKAVEYKNGTYIYMSDKNGMYNLFSSISDSTLSYVDTVLHYRYFSETFPLTNFNTNILKYSLQKDGQKILVYYKEKNKNIFSIMPFDELLHTKPESLQTTYYKSIQDSLIKKHELLVSEYKAENTYTSSNIIDFNSYIFEYESNPYNYIVDSVFSSDTLYTQYKMPYLYQTNFYMNQIVNQIDFGFLNSSYQAFTGDAFYYMPGLNFFLKFGVIDVFEDYRITGGLRFAGNFNTNEYLFSIENLKNRWDKQLIFHKQSLMTSSVEGKSGYSYYYHKIQDYNSILFLKYPLDQVQAFVISPNLRYNQDVILSTDMNSLREPTTEHVWAGISCKYIFDNTIPKTLNIMEGTRIKVFAEAFTELTNKESFLSVVGFDVRHYKKIHRNLIFASRAAYSFSFGQAPLLYYLGSVDSWVNILAKYETFNSSIEYDKSVNWAYQAIGTNMRGFSQNIRNGPSFAVVNSELRFPIVQYLLNRPISSDVLSNLQIVGFFDVGAAWAGLYPGAKENAYNYLIVENTPVTVVVDEMRSPFVYGYGYGVRSRVFGYFIRADWAWGVDDGIVEKIFYLSLSLDF